MTRTKYHHGALREALLTATLELIETEGIGSVSLRRVARAAGVSPGAPYHHFPDRAALLIALSDEGYRRLAAALTAARATADTPNEALGALFTAYVHFAQENPAYFRLMFRPELKQSHKSTQGEEAAHEAFALLDETVAACLAANTIRPMDKDTLTISIWSLVHGLASLWLDGQLDHFTDDPAAVAAQVAELVTKLTR